MGMLWTLRRSARNFEFALNSGNTSLHITKATKETAGISPPVAFVALGRCPENVIPARATTAQHIPRMLVIESFTQFA